MFAIAGYLSCMTATQPVTGQIYQLAPIPVSEREDGVIYLSGSRTFKLIAIDGLDAWVRCMTLGTSFVVRASRLRNF